MVGVVVAAVAHLARLVRQVMHGVALVPHLWVGVVGVAARVDARDGALHPRHVVRVHQPLRHPVAVRLADGGEDDVHLGVAALRVVQPVLVHLGPPRNMRPGAGRLGGHAGEATCAHAGPSKPTNSQSHSSLEIREKLGRVQRRTLRVPLSAQLTHTNGYAAECADRHEP